MLFTGTGRAAGSSTTGGDGSGGDIPAQLTIKPTKRIVNKRLFVNGTVLINGTTARTNEYFRFPWEFQMFHRSSHSKAIANSWQYWRAKKITLELINTQQVYSTNNGGTAVNGQNNQAKMYTWVDTDYVLGPDFCPGIEAQDHEDAEYSIRHDGFNVNGTAHTWLFSHQFDSIAGPRSTDDHNTQVTAQGGSISYEWNMSHQGWRRTSEFMTAGDPLAWNCESPRNAAYRLTGGSDDRLYYRWDNFGTSFYQAAMFHGMPFAGAPNWWHNDISALTLNLAEFGSDNFWNFQHTPRAETAEKLVMRYSEYDDGGNNDPVVERERVVGRKLFDYLDYHRAQITDPMPSLWIGMQNQLNQTLGGLQNQMLQVQFKWTIDIEVTVPTVDNISLDNNVSEWGATRFGCDNNWHTHPFFIPFYPFRFSRARQRADIPDATNVADFFGGLRDTF